MQISSRLKCLAALTSLLLSHSSLAGELEAPIRTETNGSSSPVFNFDIVAKSHTEIREQLTKAGFENIAINELNTVKPTNNIIQFTHHFFITNIIFRNSGWTKNDVLRNMKKSAEIFSQCGVLLSGYSIILTDPVYPQESYSIWEKGSDGVTHDETILRKLSGDFEKPLIIYVTENTEGLPAYSWTAEQSKTQQLANTIWVSRQVLDQHKVHQVDGKDHNLIAHELAHILLNEEDQNFPNLLSGKYLFSNNELTVEQCEELKHSPLVSEIQK